MEKFVISGTSVSQVLLVYAQLWDHPLLYRENTCRGTGGEESTESQSRGFKGRLGGGGAGSGHRQLATYLQIGEQFLKKQENPRHLVHSLSFTHSSPLVILERKILSHAQVPTENSPVTCSTSCYYILAYAMGSSFGWIYQLGSSLDTSSHVTASSL